MIIKKTIFFALCITCMQALSQWGSNVEKAPICSQEDLEDILNTIKENKKSLRYVFSADTQKGVPLKIMIWYDDIQSTKYAQFTLNTEKICRNWNSVPELLAQPGVVRNGIVYKVTKQVKMPF